MKLKFCLLVMEAPRALTPCPAMVSCFLIETVSYSVSRNRKLARLSPVPGRSGRTGHAEENGNVTSKRCVSCQQYLLPL